MPTPPTKSTEHVQKDTGDTTGSIPSRRKKVVVVGDWVVDEHWVTSIHRSLTRSRAGINHYRSVQEPNSFILTLAGAGKTTSILYKATAVGEPPGAEIPATCFDVHGAGTWGPEDESTLAALLDPIKAEAVTPYRLAFPPLPYPEGAALTNLGAALAASDESGEGGPVTTRIIRLAGDGLRAGIATPS